MSRKLRNYALALDGLAQRRADGELSDDEYELKRSQLGAETSRRSRGWWGLVAVPLVLVGGGLAVQRSGPSPDEFRSADPAGYAACSTFAQAMDASGSTRSSLLNQAAKQGATATTAEVRKAVDAQQGSPTIPDQGKLKSACKQAGYNFKIA